MEQRSERNIRKSDERKDQMSLKLYILAVGDPVPHLLGPFDDASLRAVYARALREEYGDHYRLFNINACGEVVVGNCFFPPQKKEVRSRDA
jgi:hypothetical protein